MSDTIHEAEAWDGIVATLTIARSVVAARHEVEATHGTAAEPAAIAALGDQLTRLEEALGSLHALHERISKGS